MRIIFQNGEIAELTNVEKIVVYNELECSMVLDAAGAFVASESLKEAVKNIYKSFIEEEELTNEQYASDTEMGNESVFERNVAQESSQHAGQTGICDIPEEAGRKGTP